MSTPVSRQAPTTAVPGASSTIASPDSVNRRAPFTGVVLSIPPTVVPVQPALRLTQSERFERAFVRLTAGLVEMAFGTDDADRLDRHRHATTGFLQSKLAQDERLFDAVLDKMQAAKAQWASAFDAGPAAFTANTKLSQEAETALAAAAESLLKVSGELAKLSTDPSGRAGHLRHGVERWLQASKTFGSPELIKTDLYLIGMRAQQMAAEALDIYARSSMGVSGEAFISGQAADPETVRDLVSLMRANRMVAVANLIAVANGLSDPDDPLSRVPSFAAEVLEKLINVAHIQSAVSPAEMDLMRSSREELNACTGGLFDRFADIVPSVNQSRQQAELSLHVQGSHVGYAATPNAVSAIIAGFAGGDIGEDDASRSRSS